MVESRNPFTQRQQSAFGNRTESGVFAYNKMNNTTVSVHAPIPRKDVLLNNMSGCTLYSAPDLVDGYNQILMREIDIPLTTVSTPSGMLWIPLRTFAQTDFDNIFIHSCAEGGQAAI
ncbi:Pol protein [Phytophthora palmivora]|uniref:Pol protein n=1 Tax=Phytophthora palmivora TaxID=4796 RepID=A0A2P4WY67_9STRA|nr:Pol protein [Phytophthora palmivora]